jgi:hypothetical protein
MTGIPKRGTSMKQMAYARRVFNGQGKDKKQIALDCGYSPNVANSVSSHIENKPGFHNAMARLAQDSNNLALAAMHEFKARGFEDFSNKDLVGALNAIGSAWSKFNAPARDPNATPSTNRLRTVILQQIENQTITTGNDAPPVSSPEPIIETTNEQEPVL